MVLCVCGGWWLLFLVPLLFSLSTHHFFTLYLLVCAKFRHARAAKWDPLSHQRHLWTLNTVHQKGARYVVPASSWATMLLLLFFFCVIVRSLNNETSQERKEKKVRPHRLAAVRDTVTDTHTKKKCPPAGSTTSKWSSIKTRWKGKPCKSRQGVGWNRMVLLLLLLLYMFFRCTSHGSLASSSAFRE